MAKLKAANQKGKYFDLDAKADTIAYLLNPYKAKHGYIGGVGVSPECPAESMEIVSEAFGKSEGVQVRHYIIAFSEGEVKAPQIANKIAQQIAAYIGREYQVVYAVHENKPDLHIHMIVNTVSYVDGHRWRGTKAEFYHLINAIRAILRQFHIQRLDYVSATR